MSSPVPRTNLDPSGGAGSNKGQSNVNAQIVNGTIELKERDCTTLPACAEGQRCRAAASPAFCNMPVSLKMHSQLCLRDHHVMLCMAFQKHAPLH